MDESNTLRQIRNLPTFLIVVGAMLSAATLVLAIRLVREMTSLTWQYGPQMVGFSLAHGYGAFLLFAPIGLACWLLVCAATVVVMLIKRRRIGRRSWIAFAIGAAVLGFLSLPQGFWDTLFVAQLARSQKAGDLITFAAGQGEFAVVKGMIGKGVSVNSTDYEGDTPLHTAAAWGQVKVVRFLIAAGANVSAVNIYGDSPLQRALDNHQAAVAELLSAAGAKALRGDEQQRRAASDELVRREMEREQKLR